LLRGDFTNGFRDYEWRWKSSEHSGEPPKCRAAQWQGEDLAGRSIMVYCEQGLGDLIQFSRYLPMLKQRGADITYYCPPSMIRLMRPVTHGINVVPTFRVDAVFDFQCALLSLPYRFNTDLSSVPAPASYLRAEDELAARWKQRLGDGGFRIGIAWQGNPAGKVDVGRSIPLAQFVPLARLPGVRLISLQMRHGLDQLAQLPSDVKVETLGADFDGGPDAFVDTAAVMANLDLVITSDTSVAHLAGALGRPTWLPLKALPDWRWMLEREDCPWYPTMRLWRQQTSGDWDSVFARIEAELTLRLAGHKT
jgi:hypothetical protein